MSVIPITCDNCGAKYKLPPTFKGSQAKCQKCGSVIDVAKQREAAGDGASPAAAAKPAAARPAAAAKPAVDRSKRRTASASSSKAGGSAASAKADKPARAATSRSRRGAKADDAEDAPRRSREKKKDNMPMILGGVGLVAIIAIGAFLMSGDDKKAADETAQANSADKVADSNTTDSNKDDKQAQQVTPKEDAKPAEAAAPTDSAKPTESSAPTPAESAPKKPVAAPEPVDPNAPKVRKEPWQKQKNPPESMADVRTALEMYGAVQWPESIDAAKKAEIMGMVEDLDVDGGIRSIRAKAKLVKEGYAGVFGLLECLSKLDYRQSSGSAFGFELNKALEDITGGLNARYAAVQADEEMHPAKALWNTKTVKAWMKTFAQWPDEAAFMKSKKARAKKNR